MRLWLDDIRPAPDGWTEVHSVNAAVAAVNTSDTFTHASLDHDLGDFAYDGGDAPGFVDWMAEFGRWPTTGIQIHSANFVGLDSMMRTIDRYSPFPNTGWGWVRGSMKAPAL